MGRGEGLQTKVGDLRPKMMTSFGQGDKLSTGAADLADTMRRYARLAGRARVFRASVDDWASQKHMRQKLWPPNGRLKAVLQYSPTLMLGLWAVGTAPVGTVESIRYAMSVAELAEAKAEQQTKLAAKERTGSYWELDRESEEDRLRQSA